MSDKGKIRIYKIIFCVIVLFYIGMFDLWLRGYEIYIGWIDVPMVWDIHKLCDLLLSWRGNTNFILSFVYIILDVIISLIYLYFLCFFAIIWVIASPTVYLTPLLYLYTKVELIKMAEARRAKLFKA